MEATGYIYIAAAEGEPSYVKIGFSRNPSARIYNLSVGNKGRLRLLGTIPACQRTETVLKRMFKPFHIRGEWYSADILGIIAKYFTGEQA